MKTLIFGAGASVPFFDSKLTTEYLTAQVCDKKEWDLVIDRYKQRKAERGGTVWVNDSYIVMKIIDQVKCFNQNADFELIAEVLDKICSYAFNTSSGNYKETFNIIISIMKGNIPENECPFWFGSSVVPFLYREIIAKSILDLENGPKPPCYELLSKLQSCFFKYVCEIDSNVSIVSLNYDDCVYESLNELGFELGFSPCHRRYNNKLDIGKFMHAKKVAYFPHGHIKFQFTDNQNVSFWNDSNKAETERWNNIIQNTLPDDFSDNYNTFIITGQTKDAGLNNMPYAIYYQRLAIDLFRSKEVYIVGYSFGDRHINRLLHSFLHLNNSNKIYIISKYADKITFHPPGNEKEQNGLVSDICEALEPEPLYSPKSDKFPKGISEINSQGYGELFQRVIFYKNGYEAFLNQFEEVLEYYYRREG